MIVSCRSPLYQLAPVALQERLLSWQTRLRRWLTRPAALAQTRHAIADSQWLSREGWQSLQFAAVRDLALHAARHTRYYQDVFACLGTDPSAWTSLDDLSRVPALSKDEVISIGDGLLARDGTWLRFQGSTSGTTGRAMRGWRDQASVTFEQAFVDRQAEWAGYRPGDRRAWLRGDPIVPTRQQGGPLWRFNRADNMLMLSSYHLSRYNGLAYLHALESFDPVLLQAYPSSVAYLARLLEERRARLRTTRVTVANAHQRAWKARYDDALDALAADRDRLHMAFAAGVAGGVFVPNYAWFASEVLTVALPAPTDLDGVFAPMAEALGVPASLPSFASGPDFDDALPDFM